MFNLARKLLQTFTSLSFLAYESSELCGFIFGVGFHKMICLCLPFLIEGGFYGAILITVSRSKRAANTHIIIIIRTRRKNISEEGH